MTISLRKIAYVLFALGLFFHVPVYAGSLTCSVTTAAACTGVVLLRMSGSINAHAELPTQSNTNYSGNVICCTGVTGLGTSCTGTTATFLKLQAITNSHSEIPSQTNYTNNACISAPGTGYVSVGVQQNNCSGYDTTLLSIASTTNSHVGNSSAYTTQICASASSTPLLQYLTFSLSSNSVNFGTLSSVQTRYASSTNAGDTVETEAFNVQVATNASSGYFLTVQGGTLKYSNYIIKELGSTNTLPSVGTPQFGMRATVSGSNGIVDTPYNGSGFAFAASATTSSTLGHATVGDSATSTYSIRLMSNIGTLTVPGPYTTNLTYVVTANF